MQRRRIGWTCGTWSSGAAGNSRVGSGGLSEDVKVDQVKAAMENGALTVTIPKEEARRSIQINGQNSMVFESAVCTLHLELEVSITQLLSHEV